MSYDPARLNILCIDDNKCMQQIYAVTLAAMGFRSVVAAWNGAEALEIMRQTSSNFDIIFCDLYMQPIDGFAFIETVRTGSDNFDSQVPIIVVSGTANIDNVEQSKTAGANEFLAKPISVQKLFSKIEAVMERPEEFQQNKTSDREISQLLHV